MKQFWFYLKLNWQVILEFRSDILVYAVASISAPLIGLAIWYTFLSSRVGLSYDKSDLILYFLLVIFVNTVTFAWKGWFIAEDINKGDINKMLLKPTPLILNYL